jgi:ankyrin repeat protein
LLKAWGDLSIMDGEGYTPLGTATYRGHLDAAAYLLLEGADTHAETKAGFEIIYLALISHLSKMIKLLTDKGTNLEAAIDDGFTLLAITSYRNNPKVMHYLIGGGVNIDAVDNSVATALWYAVSHRNLNTVRLLVQKGAKPSVKTDYPNAMR